MQAITQNVRATTTARRTARPLENVTTRLVTERRWIPSGEARIGMYVSELDRPWTETRFMFQGFRIETPEELDELRRACDTVRVDSEKLARVSSNSMHRLVGGVRREQ